MQKKVLILEDEPLIAWDIEEELISRGWDVTGRYAGIDTATRSLTSVLPHLALLDINVGSDTSYDLARQIRSLGIAVVFLSGASGDERPEDLQSIPICPKPVDYNRLQREMQRAVGDIA